jgi:PAS domain S-box-containing protein
MQHLAPTGRERFFDQDEIIVTKTDLKGRITYANRTFLDIASLTEAEAIGAPHSIIRHPDMPRAVFRLLWETISGGREIFAHVVNLATNGDHYWVFAHVTPTFDVSQNIIGYHSSRRVPDRPVIDQIREIYAPLLEIERSAKSRGEGLDASYAALVALLRSRNLTYDAFIFSLQS